MKAITALVLLALIALAESALAAPQAVTLVAQNQRSTSGTRSTQVWKDCGPTGTGPGGAFIAPCLDPALAWNVANAVVGSDATWTWDGDTGILTGRGLYWSTTFISSTPAGTSVISDNVRNLVIDTTNKTTDAASYDCIEGTFLAGIHASGCGNLDLGFNSVSDSVAHWNVGGNPKCVTLNIGGDDFSLLDGHAATVSPPQPFVAGTPSPRGLTAQAAGQAGIGCARTSGGSFGALGAFDLWTVVDPTTSGVPLYGYPPDQLLVLSNGIPLCSLPVDINCAGANWMTFAMAPVPIPTVGWLLGPAFGAVVWRRRGRRLT